MEAAPIRPRRPAAPEVLRATLPQLVQRAQALLGAGERRILGITGAPGAGKSTLCERLAVALGSQAAVVGMDGFHLANRELLRLGRRQAKGAPDTFDAGGYADLLERLRRGGPEPVYAPYFDRQLEESIGSTVPIFPQIPLILTEGNYLLLQDGGWTRARAALDQVWYLDLPDDVRLSRLLRRHAEFGKSADEAERWVASVDQGNAALIEATRPYADVIVQLLDDEEGGIRL